MSQVPSVSTSFSPASIDQPTYRTRLWLFFELVLLFGLFPVVLMERLIPLHPLVIAAIVAAACTFYLRRDPAYETRQLWNREGLLAKLRPVWPLFALSVAIFFAGVVYFVPDRLFSLPLRHPGAWLGVLLFYPVFSVYSQEVIFRAFFFHRYKPLLGDGWITILVSAIAFGWMHILFHNSFAVLICTLGGVVFSFRYRQSGSLLVTSIEHTLYGWLIFTIGLGESITSRETLSAMTGQ